MEFFGEKCFFVIFFFGEKSFLVKKKFFGEEKKVFWSILSLLTVSPECGCGFNEVPASDSTSEWARNPK